MATFLTRVELHGASFSDYEKLHSAMAAAGFGRHIVSFDGAQFQLPTAEYACTSALSTEDVRQRARAAADSTGRSSWVITVRYDEASWHLAKS